jgi:hypothetical protein
MRPPLVVAAHHLRLEICVLPLRDVASGPVMNPQQRIKVVGRRNPYSGGLAGMQGFFELCIRLRGDRPFLPRGVYVGDEITVDLVKVAAGALRVQRDASAGAALAS